MDHALQVYADLRAVGEYKPIINTEDYKEGIVGHSGVMQEVFKVIGQVTASDVTVMITGESGSGKERGCTLDMEARPPGRQTLHRGRPTVPSTTGTGPGTPGDGPRAAIRDRSR